MVRVMKDSGVEWIGAIPVDWDRTKLLHALRSFITDGPHETPNLVEKGIPFISIDSLNDSEDIDFDICKKFISEKSYAEYSKKTKIEINDILFTKAATIGKTAIVKNTGFMVWSPIAVIKVNHTLANNKYIYHLLNCDKLIDNIKLLGSSNTQINVGMKELESAIIPMPPIQEQNMIASFLDSKCQEIDNVLAKTRSSIEEYKKLKQAIITKAVTKGICKNRKMKDSGIEWIGEMPKHWSIKRGKYILEYLQKPVKSDDGVITCFRDGEVTLRSNRREDGFTMSDKEIGYQGIDKGDLVVHGMDGFAGAIGISDSRGKASPVLNVLDSCCNKKYLMYYLRAMAYSNVFVALASGIRVRSCDLRWNKLASLPYPVTDIKEQSEIAQYIDIKCSEIDNLILKKEQLISELESYKKSLIYEYVTGKKEVPMA